MALLKGQCQFGVCALETPTPGYYSLGSLVALRAEGACNSQLEAVRVVDIAGDSHRGLTGTRLEVEIQEGVEWWPTSLCPRLAIDPNLYRDDTAQVHSPQHP